ncbi:squalene/phytoene synthase family protein [Microbacterium sp. zg.Y1090]|uniref:phytoene/squalene synthase family protein n=1 Tax=Microbacterium TaxID=33882 RepID=UPI00214B41E0|nr:MULTISPECIES: squalene/phytoene synthase family protein [unclassified Microbacterium]MCR2812047.1 squalene/phytoene synthase family protein [Microbacterium sp. zg.Y1084]MCR2818514.1 squalene/phytoene synthase family protein [Microbacterium sp. zg.Y1090]MDL5486327.1 squalene/phytoene synthase family protein [Microbacterium sp. zg-Y1211]WIM29522.1 squalene/phytoene synthase family protein [Microbacterium sp. zg-Y1090]
MSTGLDLYDRAARDAAATIISAYSTSFSLATRLLGARVRGHVRNVYALVRVADEIVDGPGAEAGLAPETLRRVLDELEAETLTALTRGFSANLIVHAFCRTARETGIGADLVRPFFASMRTDLDVAAHDASSHDAYVYGSAEVVGLMCLQVFVNAGAPAPTTPSPALVDGARRLGAAFQDVNFLRDLSHDSGALGRDYLGVRAGGATRAEVLDRIDADLAAAAAVVPLLPADSRRAVTAAHDLFASLAARLRAAGGEGTDTRVRVPDPVKATLAARAMLGFGPKGART